MKNFNILNRNVVVILLLLVLITMGILSIGGCTKATPSSLTVFAAAGAKPALDEICRKYEAKYDTVVEVTYGGGGEVLSQMELTRSGDVYMAPEQSFMEKSIEKQLVLSDTVTRVAGMVPVIAVSVDNTQGIEELEDLARPGTKVAVTRRETTLLGKYAPEIFEKAGLAEAIAKNIVTEAARPDNLLTMLVMGQVDAGIIWNFYGVQAADKIKVIYLDPEQLTGIGEMQAVVTNFAADREEAQRFIDFLISDEGKETFESLGYIVEEEEIGKYYR
jgi:molybdate transport system substrate-binding protein